MWRCFISNLCLLKAPKVADFWGLVIPGALLLYKGKDILRKRIPDIITVFGLLLLGYWWWNFGGVLIYLLAFGLAVCILLDKPPYKQKKDDPAQ